MIQTSGNPEIIYEDESIVAVVKPYGMIVNNADTSQHFYTLQDWIIENIKNQKDKIKSDDSSDFSSRAGIVHRLDKETSGILLVAKNIESFKNLQAQFKNREVKKCYSALCHGQFSDEGRVAVPVGRLPWNRMRFGIVPEGRSAITDFKPVSIYEDPDDSKLRLSLIKAYPETGRTHQIRVHLQYINHPIYSDILYAGRKISARDRKRLSRHFLHAKEITFTHPITNESMNLSSDLPVDLTDFLKTLKEIKI